MDIYGIIRETLSVWYGRYGDSDEDVAQDVDEIAWLQAKLEDGIEWDAC